MTDIEQSARNWAIASLAINSVQAALRIWRRMRPKSRRKLARIYRRLRRKAGQP